MIGNMSLGQHGLERLDAELRFHAHTVARLRTRTSESQALRKALSAKDSTITDLMDAGRAWQRKYEGERKAHKGTKTKAGIIILLLIVASILT